MTLEVSGRAAWPALPLEHWQATRDTLQLLTQIVGKVRLARTPLMSHWWNVPLYVTARGLSTSLMPAAGRGFQVDFDFIDQFVTALKAEMPNTLLQWEDFAMPHARPILDRYRDEHRLAAS